MELELVGAADPGAIEAFRRASAGEDIRPGPTPARARWWQEGIAESIAGRSVVPTAGRVYGEAPSPRRTRGATRA